MPKYKAVDKVKYKLNLVYAPLVIGIGSEEKWAAIFESSYIPNVKTYFIDYAGYFRRDGLYNDNYKAYEDNAERFIFFAKAVIKGLKAIDFTPEIIHCNDWHTGLIPVYLKTLYSSDIFYKETASVMTVHNSGYQGRFPKDKINADEFDKSTIKMENLEHSGEISFLKGGVLYSDIITTVSKKYAEEIQTEEYGYDLAYVFRDVKERLFGIPNAIDYETWDPEMDKNLSYKYSAKDLSGKIKCKFELQRRIGLPQDQQIPLAGTISRLTFQKGMDILSDTLELALQDERFQFLIIGAGEQGISDRYEYLKRMFPDNIGIYWGYSEEMEHLAEAGLDIFIMPSRYEPCGLNQIYSLRYGTVPVVRATGGLDDIIEEWNEKEKRGNGFKFKNLTQEELYNIIRKVMKKYKDEKDWEIIQKNGMTYHYSWDDAVKEYEKVYKAASS